MTLACTKCGSAVPVADDRVAGPTTKIACPTCEHVFAVGEAQPTTAPVVPPKRVPPPVSGELAKTRRMSTDDMPFRVEVRTAADGRRVAVVFCVNHPDTQATHQCEQCVKVYCDACRTPLGGVAACPDCGKPMVALVQEA